MTRTRTRAGRTARRTRPAIRAACWLLAPLLLVPIAGCGGGEPVGEEPPLRPVETWRVSASDEGRSRTFTGTARARVESRLSFRVAGTVVELPVQVGEAVPRGRVLARLDPVDYELRVEEAEAGLAQARAAARNADASYDRVRGLYENANASRSDLDAARAAAESAAAQVTAGQKRLEQARQQVGYTVLRSPLEGACAALHVEVNENVAAGNPVVTVTAGDSPEVEVDVPQVAISALAAGMPATVTFDTLPERQFPARLSELAVATVGRASTYPVRVRLTEDVPEVRPGMAAEVTFRVGGDDDRILVPPVAVMEDRRGRFVYVVEEGDGAGVVRRRPVTVGELTGEGMEVRSGLGDGDLLVTAGARRLQDGDRVRSPEPTAPGNAATAAEAESSP